MKATRKKFHNPYDFMDPVRDPLFFAGRHGELEEIDYYLKLAKDRSPKYYHLALVGPRFAGKTSLVNIIEHLSKKLGYLAVKIPITTETVRNEVSFFKEILDGIITKGAEKRFYGGVNGSIYKAYRRVVDRLEVDSEKKIPFLHTSAYIGFKGKKNRGIPQEILIKDLRDIHKEARKRRIPTIVLLFDDADLLIQNPVLLQKIRKTFLELEGYILVLSGAEGLRSFLDDAISPVPSFFKRIHVENFKNEKETEECLLKPLSDKEKGAFEHACIAGIHAITNGSPYEINLVGHFMYRRWKDGKDPKIGVSPEVWRDVLKEMEGFRRAGHYEVAGRMRGYGVDLLKILVSLHEIPNASPKWLSEFMLLDEMEETEPKEISRRRSAAKGAIEQLRKDGVISEKKGKLRFNGSPFDLLYLKVLWASKEATDPKRFFIGFSEDPLFNVYRKLTDCVFLRDFPEYYIQTRFDGVEKAKGEKAEKFIIGSRVGNGPRGTHTVLEISPESRNEFYLGVPHSLRYRVNVEWMKEGFVTQVKFKKEKDKERFQNHLKALSDKLNLLGYTLFHEDEIAWHRKGAEFQKQGKSKEALACFEKAIKIHPAFQPPWVDRVRLFWDNQKYEEALENANRALAQHRHSADTLKLKGAILIQLGRNEEALNALQRASEINPQDGSLWELRARAQSNLGKHQQAAECASESLKGDPSNPERMGMKGLALFNLGKYNEALSCLNEALQLNPEYLTALLAKGQVLVSLGRYDEALICLDAVLDKEWTNIDALISKGLALSKLSRHEEAIKCWDSIVQITRNSATGWYNKACFEARMGYTDAALESLYKAIQIDKHMALEAKQEEDFEELRNDARFVALTNLVWYANYGSNLCSRRFMRYIEGGQAEGTSGSYPGCRDKTPPKDDQPIKIPYPLYFAKPSARWDNKGVAFIGLKKEESEETLGRMYLITEQQFLDVASQENEGTRFPIDLQKAKQQGGMIFQDLSYGNILYLGEQDGFPIYTFTSSEDLALEVPVAPSSRYLQYIISGLKEVYPLTDESIVEYLLSKPGIKESYTREELESLLKGGGQGL